MIRWASALNQLEVAIEKSGVTMICGPPHVAQPASPKTLRRISQTGACPRERRSSSLRLRAEIRMAYRRFRFQAFMASEHKSLVGLPTRSVRRFEFRCRDRRTFPDNWHEIKRPSFRIRLVDSLRIFISVQTQHEQISHEAVFFTRHPCIDQF